MRWLAALLLAGFTFGVNADVAVPALKARVTDLTGTLSAEQWTSLEQKLAALEAKKGSQLVVLMLPSTKPEEIEQFSIRVAEAWKIGRKGTDDGVILIVAKDDRRMRIEVGYGLEGVIPDAVAKRVISETITPFFKAGDFHGGVSAGVDQLIGLINGESLALPQSPSTSRLSVSLEKLSDWAIPAIFFVIFAGALLRAVFGRFPGALATGVVGGLAAWLLIGLGIAVLFGFIAFIVTLLNTGSMGTGSGGYSSGGSSSGGFGGGGGFSGGGGSFGGGGSSGSW